MNFDKPKDVIDYITDRKESASPMRMELAYRIGADMCYVEGVQLLQSGTRLPNNKIGISRDRENANPDSSSLRVIDNQVSFHAQKVAAGTHPNSLMVDGFPAVMAAGPEGTYQARCAEEAVNIELERSCFVQAAQDANWFRTVCGTAGIGLSARLRSRSVGGGEPEPDWDIRAFCFDPTDLILDPAERNHDLQQHECVVFETTWTAKKLRDTFPELKFEESRLRTVEELETVKCELNKLASGRIYSQYAQYSRTKAARVCQVHVRDSSGRFPTMFVVVDLPDGGAQVVNYDNPESPFAGSGMPFQLIYGHRRTDVIWGMSDVSMMRSDQDKINLGETLFWRIIQKYAHGRYFVDRRFFGNKPNDDEIARHFTNAVGKPIIGDIGEKSRGVAFPQADQPQPPPVFLPELMERYGENLRKKTHKSSGSFGELKTHVGNEQFARAQDDAAEVRDVRTKDDTQAVERLIGVLFSTTVRNVQRGNPTTLAALTRKGFDQDKLAALVMQDPDNPTVTIKVSEASFRNRSHRQRSIELDNAMQLQAIDPFDYRWAKARDLQAPIADSDLQMSDQAVKAARRLLSGIPWQPRPLGAYSKMFIQEFTEATFAERAEDPAIMQLIQQAIAQQTEMDVQTQMQSDPALRAQQQQMAMQAQQAQAAQPKPSDVGTLLAQLSGQAAQPQEAAA